MRFFDDAPAIEVPLHYLTLEQAARAIQSRRLSPVALTEACLERIDALDGRVRAFITLTGDAALAEAHAAAAQIAAGRYRGPLHGIPLAHKDNICTAGVPTTAHSNFLREWVPDADAAVYARLKAAGAVSLGKLALWEFAAGSPTPQSAFPPARNPWNTEHSPGGSSSGSAAAVSAGLCIAATGTDTGGSLRNPAAACGVVGVKPTHGTIDMHGVLPLSPTLDHAGPLTRTVGDSLLMLRAMVAPQHLSRLPEDVDTLVRAGIDGLRIGVPRQYLAHMPHDADCLAAFEEALAVLRSLGATLVDFDFPMYTQASALGGEITAAEAHARYGECMAAQPSKFDATFRKRIGAAAGYGADRLAVLRDARRRFLAEYAGVRDRLDVIASPAAAGVADSMASLLAPDYAMKAEYTRMYSVGGLPALAMPMGFGKGGLPLGIQFAADLWREDRMFQLAAAYEAASGWTRLHPAL